MIDMSIKADNLTILEDLGRLRRGINLMAVQVLKPADVGPKQALLLSHLFAHPPCSLAELSRATITDPAATGRAIDSLIKKGWVEQREHATDRRRWEVLLTPKGRQVSKEVEKLRGELANQLTTYLTSTEKKNFHSLVERLLKGLPEDVRKELA